MLQIVLLGEKLKKLLCSEKGQSLVEYGLIVALIAVVSIGAVGLFGGALSLKWTEIAAKIMALV